MNLKKHAMRSNRIRKVKPGDAKSLCDIYNEYVENTIITFEIDAVSEQEMQRRIHRISEDFPWIVYEENSEIKGYAYAAQWNIRDAYKFCLETTVYLNKNSTTRGIGSLLYGNLLKKIRDGAYHSVIGRIALPNDASIALHKKFGFTLAGHFKEAGWKFNHWIDVQYWQLML